MLERIVQAAGRRPGRVLLAVAVVAGISAALALRLQPSTATDTLVGKGSQAYKATEVYRQRFGDLPVPRESRAPLGLGRQLLLFTGRFSSRERTRSPECFSPLFHRH